MFRFNDSPWFPFFHFVTELFNFELETSSAVLVRNFFVRDGHCHLNQMDRYRFEDLNNVNQHKYVCLTTLPG